MEESFEEDYYELCANFRRSPTHPFVYLVIPPPLYIGQNKFKFNQTIINERLPELVPKTAVRCGLPSEQVIDLNEPMGGNGLTMPELFCVPDACDYFHPNDAGHKIIAKVMYQKFFGEEMPEIKED